MKPNHVPCKDITGCVNFAATGFIINIIVPESRLGDIIAVQLTWNILDRSMVRCGLFIGSHGFFVSFLPLF